MGYTTRGGPIFTDLSGVRGIGEEHDEHGDEHEEHNKESKIQTHTTHDSVVPCWPEFTNAIDPSRERPVR